MSRQSYCVWGGNLDNWESHQPEDSSVYYQLSTQNTSHPLAGHYQQQRTMGENKPDPSGGRNVEEALEVDRQHIEESTELRQKVCPHLESSGLNKGEEIDQMDIDMRRMNKIWIEL
ncbi:unnamed protein product [Schistosoma mattheei]|uniref:Uncharacterized protein n=1 Tax=Schistosoma mattheei TaxID=31246 RepID=A0A183P8P8_9TREM|nr:unnamed protein product [Schistosoma mattheei]